jgi:crossover junction endodeoxyribonuclease RusA
MFEVRLPFPPSVNHYWRHYRGRTVISPEGRTFRASVCALLGGSGRKPPLGGRITACLDAFPPDRRRRDCDNLQKSTLDAMQHAGVYEDDSQIDLLICRRRQIDAPHGHILVRLGELPLQACLLCGHPLDPSRN